MEKSRYLLFCLSTRTWESCLMKEGKKEMSWIVPFSPLFSILTGRILLPLFLCTLRSLPCKPQRDRFASIRKLACSQAGQAASLSVSLQSLPPAVVHQLRPQFAVLWFVRTHAPFPFLPLFSLIISTPICVISAPNLFSHLFPRFFPVKSTSNSNLNNNHFDFFRVSPSHFSIHDLIDKLSSLDQPQYVWK